MRFEDLVEQSRSEHRASGAQDADALSRARDVLDAALGGIGQSAAMALASHGVPAVPLGQIKRRFGYEYPEQTSHGWRIVDDLYLLRDGTWWQAGTATADLASAPPPVVRWVMGGDPEAAGSILAARKQLTGAVLQHAGDAPHGSFATAGNGGGAALHFWVADGAARVGEGTEFESSRPFEEWAATRVAVLIDAR